MSWQPCGPQALQAGLGERPMAAHSEPTLPEIIRSIRSFIMMMLEADTIALRPDIPRVRGPLTPTAERIFRTLMFTFENVVSGLCMPSIALLARTAGRSQSQTKVLLIALYEAEYLTWRHGKRKRVWTKKGWRVVRSSNQYRLFCPRRHLEALRRTLIQSFGGKCGPLIQKLVARYTPPTEEQKATAEIVGTLAADLRHGAARTGVTPQEAPSPKPSTTSEGSVEVAGIRVADPKLGS